MKPFLLFGIILISISIQAQVTQEWVRTFSSPFNGLDYGKFIERDNAGNIYVSGYSDGGSTGGDIVTIKYNPAGEEQWVQIFDANYADIVNDMVIDNLGNIYLTGYTANDTSGYDYLTIKYNSNGAQMWVKYFNGPTSENDVANSLIVDNFGSLIVTGRSAPVSGGDKTDIVTIKYDNNGNQIWLNRYNGPDDSYDSGNAVGTDQLGNIYVIGYSYYLTTKEDIIIIKYDASGVQQWQKIYSGTTGGTDNSVDMILDTLGNIYVTGYSPGGSSGNADIILLKYNYSGIFLWEGRYNGPSDLKDYPQAMALGTNGNICITGYSNGINTNDDDYVTLMFDPQGNQQWAQRYAGPVGSDRSRDIALDGTSNVYITGSSVGSGTSFDCLTIKYSSTGEQKWVERYTDPLPSSQDDGYGILVDDSENIFLTGQSKANFITIKYSQGLNITEPQAGEKWIAGETDTIKWTGGQPGQFVGIEYTTDNGSTYNIIDIATHADSGFFVWNIPDSLLSTRSKIKLTDFQTSNILAESDTFKIKPYIITKLDANGNYIAYKKNSDAWFFSNTPDEMWPQVWFQQFNYRGTDPFTNQPYPQEGFIAFKVAPDSIHPDWISWVKTFGLNACYFNVSAPVYSLDAILKWQSKNNKWKGSCFGIAGSNALAFSHKSQFQSRHPNFPGFTNPITVVSDTGVKRVVNELFTHQFGNPTQIKRQSYNPKPTQTINDIKKMLREDNVSIMTLSFWNNSPAGGGHNVLAYRLDQDPVLKNRYYIRVYDNANPLSTNPITVDTAANSGNGSWGTPDWFNWGGNKWIQLEDSASVYLQNATLNKISQSPFILGNTELEVDVNYGVSTQISNSFGDITGFVNDVVYEEIEGSRALIVTNGNITPPYGFYLPANNYSVLLNDFAEDTVETFFFTGNKSFVYERSGATQTQTDRLFFDGGVSAVNPDAETKSVNLLNLINETTQEKLFAFTGLALEQNDSIKIINPDENTLDLISYGSAKNYKVELNHASPLGLGRFENDNISIEQNTTHKLTPDWSNINELQLVIYVDQGNNGTVDDTLSIVNQVTGIGDDQGSMLTPNSYNLAQNFPNPFNPTTTIQYSIPQRSNVTLKVYDVLGNEIAALVNEAKDRGVYSVNFDASQLASGIYLYRIQAGSFVETKKMVLLK